ncbi:DUF3823 domain-containing protein [Bacteroides sp. 51]|uniref:DUF3823 domain-containing protein n=1 Tax=Bacteroides sp. 51 TaxID=2302938 RepID=UPI0013D25DFF|nr:DUF3823 domain-containing protein [Bacteroides sp. 51]NDV84315.1 DUF3823 domain-containing protein [Bacteroides sp. 51]
MKAITKYIAFVLCCVLAVSCEIDNFDEPDATIQGVLYDHTGQPLQVNHGSKYIRAREISWANGDENIFVGAQTLAVQQDGTYRNTKWFPGEYRMLPRAGNFYPYDDEKQDADDAGILLKISGTTTQDFTVTPYLTIEWVKKPTVGADGFLECSVRFKRNQKPGYEMPDVREAWLRVSRTVNVKDGADTQYYKTAFALKNEMEGQEITFRTNIALKYTGIDYWVRVHMDCKTAAGKPETNYPGMGEPNFTTIEKIHVP